MGLSSGCSIVGMRGNLRGEFVFLNAIEEFISVVVCGDVDGKMLILLFSVKILVLKSREVFVTQGSL